MDVVGTSNTEASRAVRYAANNHNERKLHKPHGTASPPTASYPPSHPPVSSYIVAYMQHHPVTLSKSTVEAQQQRSQVMRNIYLPLCLPFAVIVTLLDVSLEQDAHLPPCFLPLSLSRLCLCRVLFSNTKPPLGVERVWSSCSTGCRTNALAIHRGRDIPPVRKGVTPR